MPRHKLFTPILKDAFEVTSFQDPARMTTGLSPEVLPAQRVDTGMKPVDIAKAPGPNGEPYINHVGIDFSTNTGTPVYASNDGKIWIAPGTSSQGKYFLLSVDDVEITYAHLSEILVASGQHVKKGDLLGKTGATGYIIDARTGQKKPLAPHLHIHVAKNKQIVDAYPYVFPQSIVKPAPTPKPTPGDEGKKDKQGRTFYEDTDPYEYNLKKPLTYVVDTSFGKGVNVRRRPQRIYEVVTGLAEKTEVQIDKRADFPDGQKWGRLRDKPWHWVCLYDPYAHEDKGEWYLLTKK